MNPPKKIAFANRRLFHYAMPAGKILIIPFYYFRQFQKLAVNWL
jgi:hypothetical protein